MRRALLVLRSTAAVSLGATLLLAPAGAVRAQDTTGPDAEDQVVLAGSVTVARGEAVGEVLVFSGRVTVHGVAEGDVVVLEGPVLVSGQVNGSVIAADGGVILRESARIGGDVSSSDPVRIDPGAEVRGGVNQRVRFSLEGPLAALGELLGPVAVAVSVLLAGLALVALAPRGADAVADTLGDAPLASLGWGVFTAIALPVVAVALCVLVLGVPLGLALLLSLGLWWIVGLTWAAWSAGRALVRAPGRRVVAMLAGWAILAAVGLVPVLNAAVWALGSVVGLGAMVVATWRARHAGHHPGRHRRRSEPRDEDAVEAGIA